MSSAKGQFKWIVKYLSGFLLVVLVITAGLAFFSSSLSVTNFISIVLACLVTTLLLTYFGLMNVRSVMIFAVIALILLAGVVYSAGQPNIDSGKFQAVQLVNGQTYYGHLSGMDTANPTLTDVYTLQATTQQSTDNKDTASTKPTLINVSKVLPEPESKLTIQKDKIVAWQNLQDNSKVTEAINKDLQK